MQIGAINSTSFKNYYEPDAEFLDNFHEDPYDYHKDTDRFEKAATLTQKLVDSDDEKGILANTATFLGICTSSVAKGAGVFAGLDRLTGDRLSAKFEEGLKKGSSKIQEAVDTLKASEGKKISRVANATGRILEKIEGTAKEAYKNISTVTKKVANEAVDSNVAKKIKVHSAQKGFAMAGGIAALLTFGLGLLRKDANNDGIADFRQKSQSVYDKNSIAMDRLSEKASTLVEIVQLVT